MVLRNYASCTAAHAGQEEDEALVAYAAFIRQWPDDFKARLFYSVTLSKFGENEEALAQINAALALEPDNAEALWHRCGCMPAPGPVRRSVEDFDARWRLDKNSPFWQQAQQEKTYASQRWTGQRLKRQ